MLFIPCFHTSSNFFFPIKTGCIIIQHWFISHPVLNFHYQSLPVKGLFTIKPDCTVLSLNFCDSGVRRSQSTSLPPSLNGKLQVFTCLSLDNIPKHLHHHVWLINKKDCINVCLRPFLLYLCSTKSQIQLPQSAFYCKVNPYSNTSVNSIWIT